ncbi:MAG: thiamine phosphate synthase [Bryobacteraceae bacterium]
MKLPRLYPILDTGILGRRGLTPVKAGGAMLEGGARILQFRHKGSYSRAVFEQAEQVAELCWQTGALFVIDDRADIALLLNAGVHVGQQDLPPADVRRLIGPQQILGFSTHNEAQLRAAAEEPADYLALGPIFETASKQKPDPVVGLDELRRLRPLDPRPLVAIGGITRENARAVLEAGADSVAVIGDLLPQDCSYESIRARMEEWQQIVR